MTDTYGALQVPAQLPTPLPGQTLQPVDRVLDCIGNYLQAVLNKELSPMWEAVAPGLAPMVRRVFTADPEDVVLNESHLPALFVWDPDQTQHQQLADDWWTSDRRIAVMWMFEPGTVRQREDRMRVQSALTSTIHRALAMGRNPAWVDFGDIDPKAIKRGSVLVRRAGLIALPRPQQSQRVMVTITRESAEPVTYRAFRTTVLVTERFRRDPAAHGKPAALSNSVQSGGTSVDSNIGP